MNEKNTIMDKNYITEVAESKAEYHRQRAKMSYEEKFRIILELQKFHLR